ncbi:MAG: hypothetical protein RIR77_621 [Planctomycetota bacterium]
MTGRRAGSVCQIVQLSLEFAHGAELVVLARKADVRHVVHRAQLVCDPLADRAAWHLALKLAVHLFFHLADHAFLLSGRNRSLAARRNDAAHDVLWIERHPRSITLDHHQSLRAFHALIRGEALAACQALATTTDRITRIARAAVDHLVFVTVAVGAVHDALQSELLRLPRSQ